MIILLGMPGAGKTTQTRLLAESLGCPWFSMGELIRDHATGRDREEMLEGKIIGDEVTLQILEKALKPVDTARSECIVEGNPRSIPQAKWWLNKINAGEVKLTGILQLSISVKDAEKRLQTRGRVDDDDMRVVHRRFEEYKRSITPTVDYLKEQGLEVHEIDASKSIEEVAKTIRASLNWLSL
jgi:adenylate kinase